MPPGRLSTTRTLLRLGNWATEGPTGWTAGTGRLSSGLEHVTFITCSKHPCHSLLFDVPRLPLPRPDLFLFETTTLRLTLNQQLSSSLSHFYIHHRDITAIPHFIDFSSPLRTSSLERPITELHPRHVTTELRSTTHDNATAAPPRHGWPLCRHPRLPPPS